MDDELLKMARDPDGGTGMCRPRAGEPDASEKTALKLHHLAVVVNAVPVQRCEIEELLEDLRRELLD